MGPYFTEEEEQFRAKARAWLESSLADGRFKIALDEPDERNETEWAAAQREWDRRLFQGGYAGLAWPKEYGGRGATVIEQFIFAEEAARAGAPGGLNNMGRSLIGPAIVRHGTDEQKKRLLPKLLSGEEVWAQGFSEPNAGSDLASLTTRAELVGDEWVINGQKIWTSHGHHADWMLLLARTEKTDPPYKGISAFLVDMRSPGITVRPIRQLNGKTGFCEEFFDNVRIPKANLLGTINSGWNAAMTALGYERSVLNVGRHLVMIQFLGRLAKKAGNRIKAGEQGTLFLERLGRAYAAAWSLGCLQYTYASRWAQGAPPGPESSLMRVTWALALQECTELAVDVLGPRAQISCGPEAIDDGDWLLQYYSSRGRGISSGTLEIQRNVIAERILGLPRR
ncbi:MAG: acyl-CoA dehydrogenase family protein [Deltaproteobacteria bacterium]|nr:acyl-CoA dehydrogenase family protein [Deltaproteobacteria bacterium]